MYLNTQTNEFPRFDGDLELIGWKVGEPLPENWVKVEQDDIPELSLNQTFEPNEPAIIDGIWRLTFTVRDLTQEEIEKIAEQMKLDEEARNNRV